MEPIALKAPRLIVIQDRGHHYTYTLDPVTRAGWQKYFDGIVSTSEVVEKENISTYDNTQASVDLVRSIVTKVEGYKVKGDQPIDAMQNWRDLLPPAHLVSVASVLRSVSREKNVDAITLGGERIELSAVWGVAEDGKSMFNRTGLVHHFNLPTIEHQRRYSRESSRSIVVGGSRTGKTIWRGIQSTLVTIYDELIMGVEGYIVGGIDELEPGDIRAFMDSYHKVAAAEALFAIATVDEQEVTA